MLQVWRWSQQYQAQLTGEALPEMMELIGWLKGHIPADDSDPSVGRISHGDYRYAQSSNGVCCRQAMRVLVVVCIQSTRSTFTSHSHNWSVERQ